uniref:Taste receptor type 2 n=1 Tax=Oryctolagus cuniculus TaxID=9986 RepID=A0A5F9DV76_RABIT
MAVVLLNLLLVILIMEFIVGNLSNGFIALVNCIAWIKRRKISSVDQIITALAISKFCLLWLLFFSKLLSMFNPALLSSKEILTMMNIIWIVTCHFNTWLATSLSIFYFLKIANFSNSAFLYLKWRVGKVISVTLLLSLLFLIFNIAWTNMKLDFWNNGHKRNMTFFSPSFRESSHSFRILVCMETLLLVIPFTMSLAAFFLLVFSLWRHLRKMQLSALGARDASTQAHLKGLQTVVAYITLCVVFFLSLLLLIWSSEWREKHVTSMIFHICGMVYPSGHSCILILGNQKLRQASLSVLCWLRSRFKDAVF